MTDARHVVRPNPSDYGLGFSYEITVGKSDKCNGQGQYFGVRLMLSWRRNCQSKEHIVNALKRRVKVTAVTVCAVMAAATVTPVAAQTTQPQQPSHQSSVESKLASISSQVFGVLGTGFMAILFLLTCFRPNKGPECSI